MAVEKGRRVGQIQIVKVLQRRTHGDAGHRDVHHLVHRAGAQHLNAQQLVGCLVRDELGGKPGGIRVVVGLIVADHQGGVLLRGIHDQLVAGLNQAAHIIGQAAGRSPHRRCPNP